MLDDSLRTGVEEVERLVEYQQLGIVQHGRDDAYFLLVSHGVVAYELLLSQHLVVHKAFEWFQPFVYLFLLQTVHFADEVEVFFRSQVVDQETVVDVGSGYAFPVLASGYVDVIDGDFALVGLQQVEDKAE